MLETSEITADRLIKSSTSVQLTGQLSHSDSDLRIITEKQRNRRRLPSVSKKRLKDDRIRFHDKLQEFDMTLMLHEFQSQSLGTEHGKLVHRPGTPAPCSISTPYLLIDKDNGDEDGIAISNLPENYDKNKNSFIL